jgi:ABC-type transport system involved in multi-copper enzyme maturation permease subunit
VKELRSRMRGARGFITLTITLLLSAGVMYGLLQIMLALSSNSTGILSPSIGQSMFTVLAFLELFMVCAITPAVTAGAISGEREKLTYEMLQSTPLSTASIVWGKLVSALSYVFLLLFAAVPLASLVFIFGGVTPRDMLKVLLMLVMLAVSFGVLGLFMSALFGRTGRATVASFLVVLGLMFVPLLVAVAVSVVRQGVPPRWILAPSPISMLSSVLAPAAGPNSPLGGIIPNLGGWFMNQAITPISQTSIPRPLYHYSLPLYAGVTLVLYLLTTRLLQPAHRWWLNKKEILVGVGLVFGLAALVAGGYFSTASHYEWVRVTPSNVQPLPTEPAVAVPAQPGLGMPAQPLASVSAQEEIVLYSAVIRQLVSDMNAAAPKGSQTAGVYVLGTTPLGNSSGQAGEVNLLADEVQKGVLEQLKDLPNAVQWISSTKQMAVDPQTGQFKDGQALITLEGAHESGQDSVQIPASIQIGSASENKSTYNFKRVNGNWELDAAAKSNGGTGPEIATPGAPAAGLELTTQSELYAAVVRQLYTVDHTFGNNPPKIPMIYILTTTDDKAGDPRGASASPAKLGEDLQQSISERLKDLPAEIRYVSDRKEVPLNAQDGAVTDGGAIITLGNIFARVDGKMQVAGSIYFSGTASGGKTYLLEKNGDLWKITGTTGVEWIS